MIWVGSIIKLYGIKYKVSAIGWIGERYYWLVKGSEVLMLPADIVEKESSR